VKPRYPETKRKRIILIYTLAIVLPGILMGIMAYQGLLNEQASRDQERHEHLTGFSERFFYSIDSLLVAELNGLESGNPETREYPDYIRLAFLQTEKPDLDLIHHHLLFIPDSVESTFSDTFDVSLLDLLAKARNYKNLNQLEEAFEVWKTIGGNYSEYLIDNKTPVHLVVQLEQIKIHAQSDDTEKLQQAINLMYTRLLNPTIRFEASQFRFFMAELKDIESTIHLDPNVIREKLEKKAAECYYLIKIISERDPVFFQSKKDPAWPGINKFSVEKDSIRSQYLSIEKPNNHRLGCLIDAIPFIEKCAPAVISLLNPEGNLSWEISDSTKTDYSSFMFSDDYPDLILNVKENEISFMNSLLARGKGLYILIFVFIAGLMLVGLIFTIFSLNNELKLNRLKSDFISNVSHELKSPLTSMRHLTDLLDKDRVSSEEQRKKYYSTMLEQTKHLSYLIDNILDFSRLEDDRKNYQFRDTDYLAELSTWIEVFQDRNKNHAVKITQQFPDNLPSINIDQDAMQQVIFNLLDNAVKYDGDSRRIDVWVEQKGKEIITCVKDYGMGISKKEQERIFDRFYRSEEILDKGIRGSGIGLTIVKRIVEAHHGSINLESEPGKGSTFCVHLPVNPKADDEKNSIG
jgi:signal transduction histidine kinase